MRRPIQTAVLSMLMGCAREPGWIDDRFFVRADDDADLHVHAIGEGTSNQFILFLHGGPGGGSAPYELAPSAPTLHEDAVMVYMDQRNSGASEGHTPVEDLRLDLLAADTLAVLDVIEQLYLETRTGNPRVWLMGHSWGAMVGAAVLFDTDSADRFAGWIEVSGAHDLPKVHSDSRQMILDEAKVQLEEDLGEDLREQWQEIEEIARAADPVPKNAAAFLALSDAASDAGALIDEVEFYGPDRGQRMEWMFDRPTSSMTNRMASNTVATALIEQELTRSYSQQYRQLELPTLLVTGSYDFVVPPTLSQDVALRVASEQVELVELTESEHLPMFNQPDAYAKTLLDFIGSIP